MAMEVSILANDLEVGELLLLEAGVQVQAHRLAQRRLLLLLHLVTNVSHLQKLCPFFQSSSIQLPQFLVYRKPQPRNEV